MTETPDEYKQRMLRNVEKEDPVKVQAATAKKIAALVNSPKYRGRGAAKLRKRPAPGKWSAAEIVQHLADCEIVFAWRMRQILGSYASSELGWFLRLVELAGFLGLAWFVGLAGRRAEGDFAAV